MRIYFDDHRTKTLHKGGARNHRWTKGTYDENVRYYNFIESPELIRTNLEDFQPYDKYPGIQRFYEMLEWINGRESVFESNDCLLRFHENTKTLWMKKKFEIEGRVMIFLRDHRLNLDPGMVETYMNMLGFEIQEIDPQFDYGNFSFAFCPTAFNELPMPLGKQLTQILSITFWAWGDDEAETFDNLDRVFKNLFECFLSVNKSIQPRLK
jgi:hypothetical protein